MASTSALHPMAPRPTSNGAPTSTSTSSTTPAPSPSPSSTSSRHRTDHTTLFRTLISSSPSSISGPSSPRSAFESNKRSSASPVVGRTFHDAYTVPTSPSDEATGSQSRLTGQLSLGELQKLGTKGGSGGGTSATQDKDEERDARLREWHVLRRADREWIAEAEKIYRHLSSLSLFLSQIRRPYLTTSGPVPVPTNVAGPTNADSSSSELSSLGRFAALQRGLEDRERDEVDLKIKMALKRCRDRIAELEKGEEMRRNSTPAAALAVNPLLRLLQPALNPNSMPSRNHPLYSTQLSSHRNAILSHLSSRLSALSGRALGMQERLLQDRKRKERMRRVLREPSSSALINGGGATKVDKKSNIVKGVKGGMMDLDVLQGGGGGGGGGTTSEDVLSNLSQSDVQALELESSSLLKSLNEDLLAVQRAESKIVEISELQSQLVHHLSEQREVSQRLEEEAWEQREEVGKGNEQLEKARENSRLANRYLCIFLVGSGLGLLFLHWFD